jgi:uncharacterized protein (DUF58 family)
MDKAATAAPEHSGTRTARGSLRSAATGRFRAWAARRQGRDALPVAIHRRRIYILPTRFGLMLAGLLLAMLLAGLNYNSNLGLAYAFLMFGLTLVAMHHCHRNLLGLEVDISLESDAFAGTYAAFPCLLGNASALERIDIEAQLGAEQGQPAVTSVRARGRERLILEIPVQRRGVVRIARLELATRQPLGWFRAWTYVHVPLTVYVAPSPRGERPLPTSAGNRGRAAPAAERRGDEDFAGLRAYAPGVPLKHMAWKVLARGQDAAVRSYTSVVAEPQWLEWSLLGGLEVEARLSQLCRWVLECHRLQRAYGLRLPGIEIPPGQGAAHRTECLRALALYGAADA